MTAALEGGEWSAARSDRILPVGKTRYPFYRRLGGPQGRSGQVENLVPTGIRSRTVQPVVSRYTDWATRPTLQNIKTILWQENCCKIWRIWEYTCVHTYPFSNIKQKRPKWSSLVITEQNDTEKKKPYLQNKIVGFYQDVQERDR